MSFQVFHTEDTFLMVKDPVSKKLRHIPTKIEYSFDYEVEPVDVAFETEEENQEYINRFISGELVNVCLRVRATALGEDGNDYLGACHEKANGMEKGMLETATFHDMKNEACKELKDNILSKYATLKATLEDTQVNLVND